jgi:hypothetical protein
MPLLEESPQQTAMRFGGQFTPQETAASLEALRDGLQLLGWWPF